MIPGKGIFMQYRTIDMAAYPRRDHFTYFSGLAYPYVGVTVNVDVTDLLAKIKGEGLPFFLTVCWCAAQAANRVPEFRQRIVDGGIIEFERCQVSHTVALEDGTFCYCTLEHDLPLRVYLTVAEQAQAQAKERRSIEEDPAEALDKFFISTLPWFSYTSLIQPVPHPADSNPRLTWGKYFVQEGKILLPVSVLCNHALVDGSHIAAFYEALDQFVAEAAAL